MNEPKTQPSKQTREERDDYLFTLAMLKRMHHNAEVIMFAIKVALVAVFLYFAITNMGPLSGW